MLKINKYLVITAIAGLCLVSSAHARLTVLETVTKIFRGNDEYAVGAITNMAASSKAARLLADTVSRFKIGTQDAIDIVFGNKKVAVLRLERIPGDELFLAKEHDGLVLRVVNFRKDVVASNQLDQLADETKSMLVFLNTQWQGQVHNLDTLKYFLGDDLIASIIQHLNSKGVNRTDGVQIILGSILREPDNTFDPIRIELIAYAQVHGDNLIGNAQKIALKPDDVAALLFKKLFEQGFDAGKVAPTAAGL